MAESKPRISYPIPGEDFPDQYQCQAKDHECNEQDMAEKKQIGGQKIVEAGLHVEHLVSWTESEDNIWIENDRFWPEADVQVRQFLLNPMTALGER